MRSCATSRRIKQATKPQALKAARANPNANRRQPRQLNSGNGGDSGNQDRRTHSHQLFALAAHAIQAGEFARALNWLKQARRFGILATMWRSFPRSLDQRTRQRHAGDVMPLAETAPCPLGRALTCEKPNFLRAR